jgi:hypothetical protein
LVIPSFIQIGSGIEKLIMGIYTEIHRNTNRKLIF